MLIFALLLTALMISVILTDVTTYIIPNWVSIILLLLYPVMVFMLHVPDWKWAACIGLGCFAVGFGLFLAKIMGGGDIKLLIVTSLYAGKSAFAPFVMDVALFGGFLALAMLGIRPLVASLAARAKSTLTIPRLLTIGEPIPYGIAIAIAFLDILWSGKFPGLPL